MHSSNTEEGAPSASAPEPNDLDAARALVAEDEQRRMRDCAVEIEQVLARHGMRLEVTPTQITIVPAQ